jgi:hypothetical protein
MQINIKAIHLAQIIDELIEKRVELMNFDKVEAYDLQHQFNNNIE